LLLLGDLRGVFVQMHLQLLERLVRLPHLLGVDRVGDAKVGAPECGSQRRFALIYVEDGRARNGVASYARVVELLHRRPVFLVSDRARLLQLVDERAVERRGDGAAGASAASPL
jgi:hypothetical protein